MAWAAVDVLESAMYRCMQDKTCVINGHMIADRVLNYLTSSQVSGCAWLCVAVSGCEWLCVAVSGWL